MTFDSPEVCGAFGRAALLASDIWQRRVYGDGLNGTEPLDETRRAVLGAIRLSNMESASNAHPIFAGGGSAACLRARVAVHEATTRTTHEILGGPVPETAATP